MTKRLVEIIDEMSFKKDLKDSFRVLSESSMSRILGKYFDIGFIIISASRDCQTIKGSPCDEKELLDQIKTNKENTNSLAKDIKNSGFGFVPTYGGFQEEVEGTGEKVVVNELSFIVPAQQWKDRRKGDYKKLKVLGIELSKKYDQDSFLFKPPQELDRNAYFIDKDGNVESSFSDVSVNDMEAVYFTRLRKSGHRFSMKENSFSLYVPTPPQSTSGARKRMGELFIWEQEDVDLLNKTKRGKNV